MIRPSKIVSLQNVPHSDEVAVTFTTTRTVRKADADKIIEVLCRRAEARSAMEAADRELANIADELGSSSCEATASLAQVRY